MTRPLLPTYVRCQGKDRYGSCPERAACRRYTALQAEAAASWRHPRADRLCHSDRYLFRIVDHAQTR